jgi:copper chaperone CopZ
MSTAATEKNHEAASHNCCASSGNLKTYPMQNDVLVAEPESNDTVSFLIDGMTCMSCVNKIEKALLQHPGVIRVFVNLSARSALIYFDPGTVGAERLKSVIETAGYTAKQSKSDGESSNDILCENAQIQKIGLFPFLIGIGAALAVVGFYLGLLTLTSGWISAKMQFIEYRWWIIALSLGLGTQATLFSYMRRIIFGRNIKAAKSGLAASSGMSTASMAACCAHYLVPLMPALGLPFLSGAVAGIASYQRELLMLGVLSNLIGLGIMLRIMHKNGIINLKRKFRTLNFQLHQ